MRRWRLGIGAGIAVAAIWAPAQAPAATPAATPGAAWSRIECRPYTSAAERTSSTCGATIADGRAVAPPHAPAVVDRVIAFANHIDGRPYVWGGGHGSWSSKGYDCSGAVGFALHGAGLLDHTMVSGEMESWGEGGVGRWITVYANSHHVYMVVAGLRFDTRDPPPGKSGPRWHADIPRDPSRAFTARHPTGF
jgi:hypothetical protein